MSEAHCATLGAMRRNALRYASLIAPYNFYNSKNSKPQHPQPPPHIDQRGDRSGGDRAAVIVRGREAHGARLRIVMVAVAGQLDRDAAQVGLVKQMTRQLRAGAGQIRPLRTVARHDTLHPELRAEQEREEGK